MTSFDVLIPARLASTRLPRKLLAEIGGVPMVVRVARQAQASGADRVIVATDSEEIRSIAQQWDVEAVLTSPTHECGTDRLAEAARLLGLRPDRIVVNVQGDEPLIPPALIREVATLLGRTTDCSIATAAHTIEDFETFLNPNVVKVVTSLRGHALYFSRAAIPVQRGASAPACGPLPQELRQVALRHLGIYAYRVGMMHLLQRLEAAPLERLESLEQLRALWHGLGIVVHRTLLDPGVGVDTAQDLETVRALVQARSK